ncbi:tail fiber protein [Klebsiella phage vB_KshKPC-M]|nr:tail fiber protein [Klebsiella phage vB_KshKPC-M]
MYLNRIRGGCSCPWVRRKNKTNLATRVHSIGKAVIIIRIFYSKTIVLADEVSGLSGCHCFKERRCLYWTGVGNSQPIGSCNVCTARHRDDYTWEVSATNEHLPLLNNSVTKVVSVARCKLDFQRHSRNKPVKGVNLTRLTLINSERTVKSYLHTNRVNGWQCIKIRLIKRHSISIHAGLEDDVQEIQAPTASLIGPVFHSASESCIESTYINRVNNFGSWYSTLGDSVTVRNYLNYAGFRYDAVIFKSYNIMPGPSTHPLSEFNIVTIYKTRTSGSAITNNHYLSRLARHTGIERHISYYPEEAISCSGSWVAQESKTTYRLANHYIFYNRPLCPRELVVKRHNSPIGVASIPSNPKVTSLTLPHIRQANWCGVHTLITLYKVRSSTPETEPTNTTTRPRLLRSTIRLKSGKGNTNVIPCMPKIWSSQGSKRVGQDIKWLIPTVKPQTTLKYIPFIKSWVLNFCFINIKCTRSLVHISENMINGISGSKSEVTGGQLFNIFTADNLPIIIDNLTPVIINIRCIVSQGVAIPNAPTSILSRSMFFQKHLLTNRRKLQRPQSCDISTLTDIFQSRTLSENSKSRLIASVINDVLNLVSCSLCCHLGRFGVDLRSFCRAFRRSSRRSACVRSFGVCLHLISKILKCFKIKILKEIDRIRNYGFLRLVVAQSFSNILRQAVNGQRVAKKDRVIAGRDNRAVCGDGVNLRITDNLVIPPSESATIKT